MSSISSLGVTKTPAEIISAVESIKSNYFIVVLLFTTLTTAVFGYFIVRVALVPTRNALSSQKRFISDVAHELRTPLSVIKTNSEVTLLDESISSRLKKAIKSNIEELDRASEIINNLLTLSSLVRPEQVNFENVDLGAVIDSATSKLESLAHSKHIQMIIKKTGPRLVWGNMTALEQIVVNLLKNSINYTPSGGNINIIVGPDYRGNTEHIMLMVQDNGIGISQKDLFHIFEPFYRAERSRNRQLGSSGLGLTIVSELLRLHNGKITIKSAINRGTTVTIFFPYIKENKPTIDKTRLNEISVDFLKKRGK